MANEVKHVLDELCSAIIKSSSDDINKLVEWSRELYEHLVIMQYLHNQHSLNLENTSYDQKSDLNTELTQKLKSDHQQLNTKEFDPSEKEISILKDQGSKVENKTPQKIFVQEKKDTRILEKFIRENTDQSSKAVYTEIKQEKIQISLSDSSLALNERIAANNKIVLGLNDKIAFSRHLFNGDETTLMSLIDRMNGAQTFEQAMNFLHQARAQYGAWEDKKDYVTRLENLVRRRFGKPEIIED